MVYMVPITAVMSDGFRDNAVAVKNRAHLARRQIHILFAVVPYQESEPVFMPGDRARDELQLFQQAKLAAPILDDLPGPDHFGQFVLDTI